MKRKTLLLSGAVLAAMILVLLLAPFLINADRFRPALEARMRESLGRQVQIGKLKLAILSGGVTAEEVAIADDPAFSRGPFLRARAVEVGVEMWPLIFSQQINVTSFALKEPQVVLLRSASGKWNFSSLGPSGKNVAATGAGGTTLSIGKVTISGGSISVGRGGAPQTYSEVNLEATKVSYTSPFPFSLSAVLPGNGSLQINGQAGPINRADTSLTAFQAKVSVDHLDLSAWVGRDSALAGTVEYNGTLRSDGRVIASQGEAKFDKLRLVSGGAPARQPIALAYLSEYDLKRDAGTITKGELRSGKAVASVTGAYGKRADRTVVALRLNAADVPVKQLEPVLPALGISLPAGASLQSGWLSTTLAMEGALDHMVISGPLSLGSVRVSGFDMGAKLSAIAALAGIRTGSETNIQSMNSRLRMAPEGTRFDDIRIVMPEVGSFTGAGTISPNNELNFRMVAQLSGGGGVLGQLVTAAGVTQGLKRVPLVITGTTANPVFRPDVGGMMGPAQPAPGQQGVGGLLEGLFGGKK